MKQRVYSTLGFYIHAYATILDVIMTFPKRSVMLMWHHAVSEQAWSSELETTITISSSMLC